MKDQVTTIEQSKDLLALGVSAEKASLAYTTIIDAQGNEYETVMERDLVLPENIEGYAFTVADLLELLPTEIDGHELCIYYTNFAWWVAYRNTKNATLWAEYGDNLVEPILRMIDHYDYKLL
ncbi:MAG: hypothetical protein NC226_09700 [Bacteroides cellulosilyticus]|nr:hypothetical protein [Bacteroides cellulosilyticus]